MLPNNTPEVNDTVLLNGQTYVCVELFKATGALFVRYIDVRDYPDFMKKHYVQSRYTTANEWAEWVDN